MTFRLQAGCQVPISSASCGVLPQYLNSRTLRKVHILKEVIILPWEGRFWVPYWAAVNRLWPLLPRIQRTYDHNILQRTVDHTYFDYLTHYDLANPKKGPLKNDNLFCWFPYSFPILYYHQRCINYSEITLRKHFRVRKKYLESVTINKIHKYMQEYWLWSFYNKLSETEESTF